MKRTLFVMAVVLGFATAASAATLSVVSNQASYNVGDTITLSVSGDAQGATSYGLIGRLLFDGSKATVVSITENSVGTNFLTSGAPANGVGFAEAFNQINLLGGTANNLPAGNPFSTVTLTATAPGVVTFDWSNSLDFFGIAGAQSANLSVTIGGEIPEPTTAMMLALGLFGIAIGGRRRA
jgi:hypothetical protein